MLVCKGLKKKYLNGFMEKLLSLRDRGEKVEIIMRMKEDREDWRAVLIQLNPKSIHLRTHY